ncbi:alpha/beta fold hydrolase [Streptomyces sp. HC44]|uniref:Alpha/beta fold hydrolase n=1 Tax=Streptomyces scabichelini TaxID=2711217 RepID=A0A6G4V027_9ACTN|nr:alpha/beta fold hydrolase [Streptomyces scabichelini]NGO07398.1 alpha/beta fold hydrolase [Streptomyces scabichelini]
MTVRLAGLPLDLALWGVRQFAGLIGAVDRRLPTDDDKCEPDVSGMPVVFVHGLADRPSIFSKLQNGLRGCGAGPFVTATYNVFNPDIRVAARMLGEQVERVRKQNGDRPVCLVGHSMGGLIARYYVQRLGGDAHVPLVITLATPHSGTAMALWAPPHPVLRQLRPGSPLLAELAEPCPDCRAQFVAFYSNLDEAVIPTARGRLDHEDLLVRNVLVDGVGHLMLPVHGTVINEVRALLTDAAVQVPLAG